MTEMKTNKSLAKRVKLTRRGKVLVRRPGKNHFNAKSRRATQLAGKRTATLTLNAKAFSRYLPFN